MEQIAADDPTKANEFHAIPVVKRRPPITNPPTDAAAEAVNIHDDDLVLGVVISHESRAYPLSMLNGPNREIFNDELGGLPIAATW